MHDPTDPEVMDILRSRLPKFAQVKKAKCYFQRGNGAGPYWVIEADIELTDIVTKEQLETLRMEWADKNCTTDARITD